MLTGHKDSWPLEMEQEKEGSYFAPAETYPPEKISEQNNIFISSAGISFILDTIPNILMVLNDRRQVVLANNSLTEIAGEYKEDLLGARPGEILGCAHALNSKLGCGTTKFCRYCGAAQAIINSLDGQKDTQECRILRQTPSGTEALDLRISTTPAKIQGHCFSIFHITDISHEKRREVLERIFFHDILNSLGGIQGLLQVLEKDTSGENKEMAQMVLKQCNQILEEIQGQKDIMAAEKSSLQIDPEPINTRGFLLRMRNLYSEHIVAEGKYIELKEDQRDIYLSTDPKILSRVIGNMLKNALEASSQKQSVTLGVKKEDGYVLFWVHNNSYIPEKIQSQIFKRSFSTKDTSRGLGTYSINLLAEGYLGGKVWFNTSREEGTTFYLRLKAKQDNA